LKHAPPNSTQQGPARQAKQTHTHLSLHWLDALKFGYNTRSVQPMVRRVHYLFVVYDHLDTFQPQQDLAWTGLGGLLWNPAANCKDADWAEKLVETSCELFLSSLKVDNDRLSTATLRLANPSDACLGEYICLFNIYQFV
jgi:hypothetical protein